MAEPPGHMYAQLAAAVARRGTPRSVYAPDTTLSRRGLLTRADRRARELARLGVGRGDLVALSMGNVPQFLVLALACSKLRAVPVPVDPAAAERTLAELARRLPLTAVVRRPRGQDAPPIDYGDDYGRRARRRLAGSLLTIEALDPPERDVAIPDDAELIVEALGIGGVMRDVVRSGPQLAAIGEAAAAALQLDDGARILCAQPYTVPRFFDVVVLAWLQSSSQLVMAEGPATSAVLPVARVHERLTVVDTVRQFVELARAVKASGAALQLHPVIAEAMVPTAAGRRLATAFGTPAVQLLLLEEIGVLARRTLARGEAFVAAPGVKLRQGAAMQTGGHEVLVDATFCAECIPPIPATEPGAIAQDAWRHTGYAGKFSRTGDLVDVLGRDDGLVNLEGRRACLDRIEDEVLAHDRVTWAEASVELTDDGEPQVRLAYVATGETDLDDLEEHVIGRLPPHMIPRVFERHDAEPT